MSVQDYSFEEIVVGQETSFEHAFTKAEVETFARLSGDINPLHTDPSYAKETKFGRPVVHGMLLAALCSRLVGTRLPGKRSLYVSQTLYFRKPVFLGDRLRVRGKVLSKSAATRLVELEITIVRNEEKVFDGVANVHIL